MRKLLPVLAILGTVVPGCGGGGGGNRSPTGPAVPSPTPQATPTPAPGPVPVIQDGGTERPVTGATVDPARPGLGFQVTVQAPGYVRREQRFDGSPVFLWPGTQSYVADMAHSWPFRDGTSRLVRWTRPFRVTLEGSLASDPAVVARMEAVLEELERVSNVPISLGPGGDVVVGVDPSVSGRSAVAITNLTFTAGVANSATVDFVTKEEISGEAGARYENTLLHEFGHVLGMGHSPDVNDVMTPGAGPGTRFQVFQPNEELCAHMMYAHRAPGDRSPDRDAALDASAASAAWRGRTTVEIVDR
jgi:hypothetical protein